MFLFPNGMYNSSGSHQQLSHHHHTQQQLSHHHHPLQQISFQQQQNLLQQQHLEQITRPRIYSKQSIDEKRIKNIYCTDNVDGYKFSTKHEYKENEMKKMKQQMEQLFTQLNLLRQQLLFNDDEKNFLLKKIEMIEEDKNYLLKKIENLEEDKKKLIKKIDNIEKNVNINNKKKRKVYTQEEVDEVLITMKNNGYEGRWKDFSESDLCTIPYNSLKNFGRRKQRKGKRKNYIYFNIESLEKELIIKIKDMLKKKRRTGRFVICNEAQMLAKEKIKEYIIKNSPHIEENELQNEIYSKLTELKFPNRNWFFRFKKRNALKRKKQVGDAPTVNLNEHAERIIELRGIIAQYLPEHVFNFDETSLYYNGWNTHYYTIDDMDVAKKKCKNKVTLAMCANSLGEVIEPIIIGKNSARNVSNELYHQTKNGWMTKNIFQEFVDQWNEKLVQDGIEILLLVDNFSGHKVDEPSNIRIEFLPANTTSKVQPLDLGVIANFKHYFRQVRESDEFCEIDRLSMDQCFEITVKALEKMTEITFTNCFNNSPLFMDEDEFQLSPDGEQLEAINDSESEESERDGDDMSIE